MKIITTLFALIFFAFNLSAQDLSMIRSKDALRTYALEQSSIARASIYTSLYDTGNDSYKSVRVSESTAAGIISTIHGMDLSVNVVNPNDPLYIWAGVYNADGDELFFCYRQFYLMNGKGGYTLPPDYGNITLNLSENIPIKVNNAQSAFIDILDDNGNSKDRHSLYVQNGKIYFPRQLAGTNAIVGVYISGVKGVDSSWQYWNVNNGSKVNPEHFGFALKPSIRGVVSIADADSIQVAVRTENGIGDNITAEYKSTSKAWVGASFYTTEGKWFIGAWVRKAGSSDWTYYKAVVGGKSVSVNIPMLQGIYYVVPNWNDGDLIEPADPYYPPYEEEGKG